MKRKFKFKGGPYDGQGREVESLDEGRSYPATVRLPHPDDTKLVADLSWGVGDETPPAATIDIRHVEYHLTKINVGGGNVRREYWTEGKRDADLREQRSLRRRVAELEEQLAALSERFERTLETNNLWDGS